MTQPPPTSGPSFVRALGLFDATMLVVGSMIGSGIFIVSADIARNVGSSGWLLAAWVLTGVLTITGALAYGELAGMMPRAGGQYVYLREAYSPLWGFLYGWALFLVIQTGGIAAIAIGFAKFLGVLLPWVSPNTWVVAPVHLSHDYALSLSVQQLVAILSIVVLTWINMRGLRLGKLVQNATTAAKTFALAALVLLGLSVGCRSEVLAANFAAPWTPRDVVTIRPELIGLPAVSAASGILGLVVASCVAQVGSLFSADAWNNVTFTAAEVIEPRKNIPRSLVLGTALVIGLYLLANLAYLAALPFATIQTAPDDRVATLVLEAIFGPAGGAVMAAAIVVSAFGCNNAMILAGARVYWAMARDGLFFRSVGTLNARSAPAMGLLLQCVWSCLLVLPRTRLYDGSGAPLLDPATGAGQYGNLYSALLDYVMFAVLLFYVLTIAGLFVLRKKRPEAERPYRAFGYPLLPGFYIAATSVIMAVLIVYKTQTTWPGLLIVLTGVPAYWLWRGRSHSSPVPGASD